MAALLRAVSGTTVLVCVVDIRGNDHAMQTAATEFQDLGAKLVGDWTTQATHPAMPGLVVQGTARVEWLEGERFVIVRAWVDHPDFPDSISIIGDTDGLQMHWFDSRGVHRLFDVTVTDEGWEATRHVPASSSDFSQRIPLTFADGDRTMTGTSQISHDDQNWDDDLAINYRRAH
jgi:DNA-binding transcriptional regulator/RsmH inhibitor MraZ